MKLPAWIENNPLYSKLKAEYGFRALFFSFISFLLGVLFGIYYGVLGIVGRSIWYGALAAYYIFLTLLRGWVLLKNGKMREKTEKERAIAQVNAHLWSGVFLLVVNMALSVAIAQMIFDNQHFSYPSWTIYGAATYAFYNITTSIIDFCKSKKQGNLTVETIRHINLIASSVSILTLQTALLNTFSTGEVDISLFNTMTGIAVSLITLTLGVLMIIKGSKTKKELKKNDGEI